jgi:hypothetical protein
MLSVKNDTASSERTLTMGRASIHLENFDRHEKVSKAPGRLSERPHHVQVSHDKRPRDGDGLKRLRQEVSLSSVELAPFTTPHDVLGVCDCRGLVETLSEILSDKCSWTGVVSKGTGIYLL